ncbi:MAG TPA: hypothetical protein VHZ81_09195 [Galbitalea sp.]|jgi:hypothetical protein|nr:hypothetical protein [Galbitalea sp.]
MPTPSLIEIARIPTSGARAVERFELDGNSYLAIPQLAYDVAGEPANMNGGDSNTDLLLMKRSASGYVEVDRLPAPGGEDAEFFRIGNRSFLATASIRKGAGPYDFAVDSAIFEWIDGRFQIFQTVPTYAAKQWRYFTIGERHFLAVAQGLTIPGHEANNLPSRIYEWDGEHFELFQDLTIGWGYNWHFFEVGDHVFLAHADHARPSTVFEWTGTQFVPFQEVAAEFGRSFASFRRDDSDYLLVAVIQGESTLLRFDGSRFVEQQRLRRPAAREFAVIESATDLFIVRANFIEGTPANPTTALASQVYEWDSDHLTEREEFATEGACDVATWRDEDRVVAVANSLTADVHFGNAVVLYRFAR